MKLGRYYISFAERPRVFFDEAILTQEGIPLLRWKGKLHHFPIQIAQWGLYQIELYLSGDKNALINVRAIADYFENAKAATPSGLAYEITIERDEYGLTPPWLSAMAQGEAASFLFRAAELLDRDSLRETGFRALNIIGIPVADGGVMGAFPDGTPCAEEYPTELSTCVLNGALFAMFGLWDAYLLSGKTTPLFDMLKGIADNLSRYDMGFWSRYQLGEDVHTASVVYHWLHIKLLDAWASELQEAGKLYDVASVFARYSTRWENFYHNPLCRALRIIRRIEEKYLR